MQLLLTRQHAVSLSCQACIYIPPGQVGQYSPSGLHGDRVELVIIEDEEHQMSFDVEEEDDGYETRMRAYNAAWQKCLDRVRVSLLDFKPSICGLQRWLRASSKH